MVIEVLPFLPYCNHGSMENGCISNVSFVSFHLGAHFPLNHDYGRKMEKG